MKRLLFSSILLVIACSDKEIAPEDTAHVDDPASEPSEEAHDTADFEEE